MDVKLEFNAKINDKVYTFRSGAEVYIFHTGIYKDMLGKYNIDTLLKYVDVVFDAYLSDSNRTPLGALADYVADNWDDIVCESPSRYELLDDFYEQYDII